MKNYYSQFCYFKKHSLLNKTKNNIIFIRSFSEDIYFFQMTLASTSFDFEKI